VRGVAEAFRDFRQLHLAELARHGLADVLLFIRAFVEVAPIGSDCFIGSRDQLNDSR
jgi:hypothetical protein